MQAEPYTMLTCSSTPLKGNRRFEGFAIDLIHELSLILGFNYTFTLQEDKMYDSMLDKVQNHVSQVLCLFSAIQETEMQESF